MAEINPYKLTVLGAGVGLSPVTGNHALLIHTQEAGNIALEAHREVFLAIREAIEKLLAAFDHPQGQG